MLNRIIKKKLFYLIAAVFIASCGGVNPVVKTSSQHEYDYNSSKVHPDYYIYHNSDDSSRLYYRIPSHELLFTRTNPGATFVSRIKIQLELFKNDPDDKSLTDSLSLPLEISNETYKGQMCYGEVGLKVPAESSYKLIVRFLDVNRNTGSQHIITFDKLDKKGRNNFLVWDETNNAPLFNYQKIGSGKLTVKNDRDPSELKYYVIEEEINFPPPSFSDRRPKLPALPNGYQDQITDFKSGNSYFITSDSKSERGVTVSVREENYPNVKDVRTMCETVRYIATRNEYDYLTSGHEAKKAIDEFWIECGGSKNRAKQLIKVYYNRIESANHYFTHIVPGWKTDRGLILIVYGKPNRIKNYRNSEVWIYGEEGNINSLSFTFKKVDNIYSENHYVLERHGDYKKSWELAVSSWRNGRIYNK